MQWYAVTDEAEPDEAENAARERILNAWADAPLANLELCSMILSTAREQVELYAPAPVPLGEGEDVPDPPTRYVLAQLQQAKNLWNASRVTSSEGDIGAEGYTFTPRPLDKTIRQMIRPVDGRPHVL
jgi:hypothetical protein